MPLEADRRLLVTDWTQQDPAGGKSCGNGVDLYDTAAPAWGLNSSATHVDKRNISAFEEAIFHRRLSAEIQRHSPSQPLLMMYLLRAIMIPKWLFLTAVFRPLRTVFRGLGAGFWNLGGQTEKMAKKREKTGKKWARNGLKKVGASGNHYCAE